MTIARQGFRRETDLQPISIAPAAAEYELSSLPTSGSSLEADDLDNEREVTVDEVLQHALDHHPLLRARQHEVEVARAKLVTAGLIPNPQFVLDTQSPTAEGGATDLTTRVTFAIPIGGKRRLRKEVARAGIRRAQCVLSRQTEQILLEAADAAIEVLYLQELLSLNTELSGLAEKLAEGARPTIDGRAAELSIEADIDAASAEAERLDTSRRLAVGRLRLARAIGLPPPALLSISGSLAVDRTPLVPLETVLAVARTSRPELAEARASLTQSRRQHALAHAEAKPDPEMGPRYQNPLGRDGDGVGVRLNMELPLFDRNQGAICETAAQVQANRAMLDVTQLTALSDVASVYVELESIQSSLEFYDGRIAELVEETEALLRDEGIRNVISENQASEILLELSRMRVQHLQLRYRYDRLLTRLQLFLGCQIADLHEA